MHLLRVLFHIFEDFISIHNLEKDGEVIKATPLFQDLYTMRYIDSPSRLMVISNEFLFILRDFQMSYITSTLHFRSGVAKFYEKRFLEKRFKCF